MKTCLQDFIKTELALHAKALELYTLAYNHVSEVDEEQDFEVIMLVYCDSRGSSVTFLTSPTMVLKTLLKLQVTHPILKLFRGFSSETRHFIRIEYYFYILYTVTGLFAKCY